MRESGVLMPIFSLPSEYGIGCFSTEAYRFVDLLAQSKQKYWQILPLCPVGGGNSPYQSCSAFAGNYLFIDVEEFVARGYISIEELNSYDWGNNPDRIDYDKVKENKSKILWRAFVKYTEEKSLFRYLDFTIKNKSWLIPYAEYMAEKEGNPTNYYIFEQYIFDKQWTNLKTYANAKGIKIIGDLPIYVSLESADVEYNKELFQLDENGHAINIAGCPPDDFSADGQVWGNPLYDWDKHKETNYEWWTQRIKRSFDLYDVVRIDHFRAFYDYFSIPAQDNHARNGQWKLGPAMDFFNVIKDKLGELNFIAEDLGYLSPGVHDLMRDTGFPGMKILQFAFNGGKDNPYLLENLGTDNCVIYTGTHDNDTTTGWFNKATDWEKHHLGQYIYYENACRAMIELAMSSRANLCIIPMQDYLDLDSDARINVPGTATGNWEWRLRKMPRYNITDYIKYFVDKYNR